MWQDKALLVFLAIAVPAPIIFAYFFSGDKDNLDKVQAALGIATGVITALFVVIYGLLFYWVQARSEVFVPLVLVLCFINSLISTIGLTVNLLVKQ